MRDALLDLILLLFGFACVGCEVLGAYQFLWAKFGEWNYLVVGGMLVTSLAGVLPLAAERARRKRHFGKMAGCWLAIPMALLFVFTAAVERTGLVADTDEASRKLRTMAITIAEEEIKEAKDQKVKDEDTVARNCNVWGPICDKAKADLRATEKKLAAARATITKSATVTDNSMAKRIVAVIPGITERQVQLYHPLLLPVLLGLLGSLCIAVGGAHDNAEGRKPDWLAKASAAITGRRARRWEIARAPVEEPDRPKPDAVTPTAAVEGPHQLMPTKPRLATRAEPYKADVHRIMKTALGAAKEERADLGQCLLRYQAEGGAQCTPNEFMLCVVAYCKASKIRTQEIDGRIYLMDVVLVESQTGPRSLPGGRGVEGRKNIGEL
jgi:hypothetical protein